MGTGQMPALGSADNPNIQVVGPTPALSGKTAPMFSPDGKLGDIPVENVAAARANGFKNAVAVVSKDGQHGYVPSDKLDDAIEQAGMLPVDPAMQGAAKGLQQEQSVDPNNASGARGVAVGVGKGMTETGKDALNLAGKIVGQSNAGDDATNPLGAGPIDTDAANTSQSIGKMGETIAEFALGDEALKGLSVAKKLGIASKIADIAESSPTLAKALDIGLNAVRQGTVGSTQEAVRGGTAGESLEAGAGSAAGGAALDAIGRGMDAILPKTADAKLPSEETSPSTKQPGTIKQAVQGKPVVYAPATKVVGDTAADIAAKAGTAIPDSGIDAMDQAAEGIMAKSKGLYKQIDEATGGKFSGNEKLLRNNLNAMRNAATDQDVAGLQAQREQLLQQRDTMLDQAQASGVPKETVEQAKATFKHASALQDTDMAVFRSRVVNSTDEAGRATLTDPQKLLPKLQVLDKSGRLAEAFDGDTQAAERFLSSTAKLAKLGDRAARLHKVAVRGGVGAGAALGGGALSYEGYELVKAK